MQNMDKYLQQLISMVVTYVPKIVMAFVVLIIGMWIVSTLVRGFKKTTSKSRMEISLQKFLSSLISISLKIMVVITVMSMMGIETTSFIAVLGAAGLAIGLALQGSLANFAGGVLILIFKPFKVGDYIDGAGHSGTISAIEVLATTLKTPDNRTIIIPNGLLSGSSIINYSTENKRRVDFTFGIGYDDDMKKAKDVIRSIIDADSRILKTPEPFIAVGNLGDSTVDITVRVWAAAADYWDIHFSTIEKVKETFDANHISIPYPQMDIHSYKDK